MPYMEQPPMQQQRFHLALHHHSRPQNYSQYHHHHHLRRRRNRHHGGGVGSVGCHNQALRWQQIYTVAIIVGVLITTLYGIINIPFDDTSIIPDLVSIIVFVMHFISILTVLVETMLSYDKHFELISNNAQIQVLLKQLLQTQLCVHTVRQRQRRKYGFYVLSVYGCLVVVIVVIALKEYYGYFWHSLVMILILRSRCFQMLILLDYIFYYLELLNVKLNALISCRISKNYQYLDVDYPYLESYDYMENVKFIYQQIYMLHKSFNDLFGLSLLMILSGIALDIIIHVYWSFLTLMELYQMYFLYVTVATLIPLFIMIFMLCFVAEDCEKQCNLILISLKRLIKPTLSCQSTADYNALLQDFIMQILHQPIRISANDYFTINLKFLMGISANIVTYLVILLQFRKTSAAKKAASDYNTSDAPAYDSVSYDTNITTNDRMIYSR